MGITFKRLYDHTGDTPRVTGVEIKSGPAVGDRQVFSTHCVENGIAEGWLSMIRGSIVVHSDKEDQTFHITRGPGHYCSHCDERLGGDVEAQMHVMREHAARDFKAPKSHSFNAFQAFMASGAQRESPDPESPAGYCKVNAYVCVRET